jgi:hypothetical protein
MPSPRRAGALAAPIVLVSATPIAAAQALYGNPMWPSGSDPRTIACADFDHDGYNDIVLAVRGERWLWPRRNNGWCTDFSGAYQEMPFDVDCVAAGDIDLDGEIDLVSAHAEVGAIGVVMGEEGDFEFSPPSFIPGMPGACRLVLTDLDLDAFPDIVVTSRFDGNVWTLLNQGDGTFGPPMGTWIGHPTLGLDALDLNGDQFTDVVVCLPDLGLAEILWGDGAGGFYDASLVVTDHSPQSVVIAEIDGFPWPDLAFACLGTGGPGSPGRVSIAINLGGGNIIDDPGRWVTPGGQPVWIDAGDIDGDGWVDLVTANHDTSTVTVLRNRGGGVFATEDELHAPSGPTCVVLEEMDYVEGPEIVLVSDLAEHFSVFLNYGEHGFSDETRSESAAWPVALSRGDVGEDDDRDSDVAIASAVAQAVYVHTNDGSGELEDLLDAEEHWLGDEPADVVLTDLDGDGDRDLAVILRDFGEIVLLENDGAGTHAQTAGALGVAQPVRMLAGDLDGDALPELVVADDHSVAVLHNLGGLTFAPPEPHPTFNHQQDIALADLDGDDDLDILCATQESGYLLNEGGGVLGPYTIVVTTRQLFGFRVEARLIDLHEGVFGRRDLIFVEGPYGVPGYSMSRYRDTSGTLAGPWEWVESRQAGPAPTRLLAADINKYWGDEVLLADAVDESVRVYEFLWFYDTLWHPTGYGVGPGVGSFVLADMDRDTRRDLVAVSETGDFVSVLLSAPTPFICGGDLDGDNDTDVFDFSELAANFGRGPNAGRIHGDFTGDGWVDVFDFAMLAADFGCNWDP